MPVFEFHCKTCKSEFKTLRRSDKLSEVACPDCGSVKLARLLSVTAAPSSGGTLAPPSACSGPMLGGGCCGGGCNLNN